VRFPFTSKPLRLSIVFSPAILSSWKFTSAGLPAGPEAPKPTPTTLLFNSSKDLLQAA
jgi:hypothetical protein